MNVRVESAEIQGMTNQVKTLCYNSLTLRSKSISIDGCCDPSSLYPDLCVFDSRRVELSIEANAEMHRLGTTNASLKLKELTADYHSCGSYDLIRYNAIHLTSNRRTAFI